jgi:2'-5' RNA ligase
MGKHLNYDSYQKEIREKAEQLVETLTKKPANRYRIHYRSDSKVQFEPRAYSGYTILARPYPIDFANRSKLEAIQRTLRDNVFGFAPVPSETFHMTIANLVSGNIYEAISETPNLEPTFRRTIETILDDILTPQEEIPLTSHIIGIGSFPGVVVALVDFKRENHYSRIEILRNHIYKNPFLTSSGVRHDRPFLGHITLGYLEAVPPTGLDNVVSNIRLQENFSSDDWAFEIREVALHSFRSMSEYQLAGPPHRI